MSTQYEAFGKYVLLEKLATGGMAEVFLARGTGAGGIGKFFAIKRILPQYADSPEFIDMFKDEAKIAINLNHSNIVSIHEFGVQNGQFFLVMDYVEGRNLRQILNKMKKSGMQFSIDQVVYMIKEVAAGLDHAHRCIDTSTGKPLNITHRDMSPQNVMVSFEGELKIVDFGIAKAESQLETTRAGTLKGKFGYMSPEQAEGQPIDLRTDIFSLGIVLWELLANDRLFVANNEINTLRKIRDCQIPPLRRINPNIHTELERIVQKALARDRNLRYQTAAALHRDLNRFLNRQYPDFSPHDFAVFIKSVFADEILGLRKRLLEYSKVNLNVDIKTPKTTNFDDRTSLLDTNTSSLILSDSNVVPPADAHEGTRTEVTATMLPQIPASDSEASTSKEATGSSILDDSLLAEEMKRDISVQTKAPMPSTIETEEITSPGSEVTSRSITRPMPVQPRRPANRNSSARVVTLLTFLALCFGVYAYLAKHYPGTMSNVVAATDPYMHSVNQALGIQHAKDVSSYGEHNRSALSAGPTMRPPTMQSQSEAPSELTSPLVVTSTPSGAEIWINGHPTGMFTPSRMEVSTTSRFSVAIRKHGYSDFSRSGLDYNTIQGRLDARLQKLKIAHLDIEIFPPQKAALTINGHTVNIRNSMLQGYEVPAGVPLHIRAVNKEMGTADETVVKLGVNARRSIRLVPKKDFREPSGY